jgi:hypothetical protein
MKFLRVPASVVLISEIEGEPDEIVDGVALVNIDEIQNIIASDNNKCTIYFKSGDSIGCLLSLDGMMDILPDLR